jgi:hypothetical protein
MGASFERHSDESLDIDLIHKKAESIISNKRISEKDFIEPYGESNVMADLARVTEIESKFVAKETDKISDIFEALVVWNGEQSNWLGENAVTIQTSRYDDVINGVDAVIEFQGREPRTASYLGLAADVTFSMSAVDKFDKLRGQIENGELSKVKYFHSSHMSLHGQLSNLPEVVIGVEGRMVLELGELWLERQHGVLAEHKVQIMLLKQIREQLITFAMYAESLGKDDIANIYKERLLIIEDILNKKADLVKRFEFEMDDSVHNSIMNYMKRWQTELRGKK